MCYMCEREEAERAAAKAAAEAALKAAEPKRTLAVSEILRGEPCYTYEQKLDRFSEGTVEVTVRLAVEQADDWDWYWAASRLLTEAGYEKFSDRAAKASNEMSDLIKPYRELRNAADQEAVREYNRIRENIVDTTGNWDKAYEEATKVYNELNELSLAAYQAAHKVFQHRQAVAQATAFAELYIGEEGTEEKTGNDRWYAERDEDSYYDEDEDY